MLIESKAKNKTGVKHLVRKKFSDGDIFYVIRAP